jgi:hypothetical protein
MRNALLGLCVIAIAATASAAPKEDRRDVGGLTYALPAGWNTAMEGGDHARLTHADSKRYCIVSVYQSRAAGGDLDADFAKEWQAMAGGVKMPAPARRKIGGRTILEASAPNTISGTALLQRVVVLDGGSQITTLVVLTADAEAARAYQPVIDGLFASIVFPGAAPAPEPAPATAPAPASTERPDRVLIGTLKPSVTLADLAGTWNYGAGSVATYVNSSTGNYSRTSTVFYGETYVIKANGTFTYSFVGRSNNYTVREKDNGTITLDGGFVSLKFKGTRGLKKHQLIAFVNQPTGASVMTLIGGGADYKGESADWISQFCGVSNGVYHCVGSEEWGRAARTKAAPAKTK